MKIRHPFYKIVLLCLLLSSVVFFSSCSTRPNISKETLDQSIIAGCHYLNNSQTDKGNFVYEQNFVSGELRTDDNQVRQAGALWGLTLAYKHHPDIVQYEKIKKGLDFYYTNFHTVKDSMLMPVYVGERNGSTGSLALIILAHVELLSAAQQIPDRELLEQKLDGLVRFLVSLRKENGQFYSRYSYRTGKGSGSPSPYFDGEALLAMCRSAKYTGYDYLIPLVMESAENMYMVNVTQALEEDPDSKTTKGFYQWGSMSFYEIHTAGWASDNQYASRTINLAYWMIDVHKTLKRRKNTAYAYEGISVSYELAKQIGNIEAEKKFENVMNRGLTKLTSWQVLGPIPNSFLRRNIPSDSTYYGGIMNSKNDPWLRIDVVQHQLHATILARSFLFE